MRAARYTGIAIIIAIALLAGVLFASWLTPAQSAERKVCPHSRTQTARVTCLVKAAQWQRHARIAESRHRWKPTRDLIVCAVAAAFSEPCKPLLRTSDCEDPGLDPLTTNASGHTGWFQESTSFMRDNHLPFADASSFRPARFFTKYNPLVNVLAAVMVWHNHGKRQWTCAQILGLS